MLHLRPLKGGKPHRQRYHGTVTDTGVVCGAGQWRGLAGSSSVGVTRLTPCKALGSRPRLFGEEASDIGNDLIAMTPLRQQNRVSRSAEKTGTYHGKDNLAQRRIDDVLVEGVKPRFVQRRNSVSGLS